MTAWTRPRWFVGYRRANHGHRKVVLRLFSMPEASPKLRRGFAAFVGPFTTLRAANFAASPAGTNNPHVQTVADAEQIARKLEKES